MKIYILLFLTLFSVPVFSQTNDTLPNIFIITTDGFRWQEIFKGADSSIITNPSYVKDTALLREMFWHDDPEQRRRMLMPFVWNILAKEGSLYGNRNYENNVSVANPYRFSYAGYNELLTGYADPSIIANRKKRNVNENLLHFLNNQQGYKNKVAAFASWNLFEYILNKQPADIYQNSGYRDIEHDSLTANESLINTIQQLAVDNRQPTRNDMLTFVVAKEYIQARHPKVVFVGFGETDEYAHSGKYDEYLQSAHLFDEFISQLWYLVKKDPFYKHNTCFIITTDHGRGARPGNWTKHSMFINGSSNTWLMTLGPGLESRGEARNKEDIYTEQLARTIAQLLGLNFFPAHPVGDPVTFSK